MNPYPFRKKQDKNKSGSNRYIKPKVEAIAVAKYLVGGRYDKDKAEELNNELMERLANKGDNKS